MDLDIDSDFEPQELFDNDTTTPTLRRRRPTTPVELSGAKSASKKSKKDVTTRKPKFLPETIKGCTTKLQHLKKRLTTSYFDPELSTRVVHMSVVLQKQYLVDKDKNNTTRGRSVEAPKIRETVCSQLGISSATYSKIMTKEAARSVYTSVRGGNTGKRDTRIPQTEKTKLLVREFVRRERAERRRVTAVQVMEYLVDEKILFIRPSPHGGYDKADYKAAHRATQRWLVSNDYRRGKRSGNVVLKEHIKLHRDRYLQAFFANRAIENPCKRLREVYLDESYIHQHYKKDVDSIWDPNDEQDIQVGKLPNKGNRYCFLCAIQGPDPSWYSPNHDAERDKKVELEMPKLLKPGVVPGSVWTFCPQQKKDHKGDYHKVFNSENFVEWWKKQLLPNLEQPSLIIMDNASYHKKWPSYVPKLNAKKAVLQEYLTRSGVPFQASDTCPILKELVREQSLKEKSICEELAEKAGHRVLFTPPHHSDLQPIELLWAKLKGNIGRKYDSNTTMTVLKERLDEEFDAAKEWRDNIGGMIRKTSSLAHDLWQRTSAEDRDRDQNSDSECSDSSDDEGIINPEGDDDDGCMDD